MKILHTWVAEHGELRLVYSGLEFEGLPQWWWRHGSRSLKLAGHIELAVWKQRVNKKRRSPRSGSLLPARLHLLKVQQPSHLPLQLGPSVLMQSLRETSHLSQECKFSSTDFPACLGCGSSSSSSSGAKRIQCNEGPESYWIFCSCSGVHDCSTQMDKRISTHVSGTHQPCLLLSVSSIAQTPVDLSLEQHQWT